MSNEAHGVGRDPRPTTRRTLTTAEVAIAELVSHGLTNREVAAELRLSPKTVEWNLTKIYRVLDVRSRTELAAQYGHLSRESSGAKRDLRAGSRLRRAKQSEFRHQVEGGGSNAL